MRTFVAALFLSLMQALPAQAAAPDHGRIVAAVSSRFLAPRYKALAEAGRDNAAAWKSFCGGTGERSLSDLHSAHRALALAFSTVQAFRFGPVGEGSTAERLYFWPERKNAVAKGLAGLMAGKEPIGARRIAQASAAARGIPALERLAFPDGEALPDTRSCEAGVAVSADLAAGLAAVSTAWNEPGKGIADRMVAGKLDPALAPDMQQAASRLVTDFMTALAVIQDQKLEPVLGRSAEDARPALAEARRSRLTRALILGNLLGLQAFVAAMEGSVDELPRKSWAALIARLMSDADAIQDFPEDVADPAKRRAAEALLSDLREVRAILKEEMPAVLGLRIGFNGLDGD
jgi:predicted lipoprotein